MDSGARAGALSGSATALPEDVWGYANPASRATLKNLTVGFFTSQGYGLPELRLSAVSLAYPASFGTLAAGVQTFGFKAYRRNVFLTGYAHSFRLGPSRRLHLGADLRYYHTAIPEYGSAGMLGLSIGWMADVLPGVTAGFQAANLNVTDALRGPGIDRFLAIGAAYHPADRFYVLLDVVKEERFPLSVRSGIEVRPAAPLALRTGIATAPVRFAVGCGLRVHNLTADLAAERHAVLGWTPGLSVALSL